MNVEFVPPRHQLWRLETVRLHRLAERLYSLYIRKKDADIHGIVQCFTCHSRLHYTQMQCGHYVSRQHMSTKFLEVNNHPQCPTCNMVKSGNLEKYRRNLDKKYGKGMADYIHELSRKHCKYLKSDFIDLITLLEKGLNL